MDLREKTAVNRGYFVGVAGATGSGKTTLADELVARLPAHCAVRIGCDAYYRDRPKWSLDERSRQNFDHPDSLEFELLAEHLQALRRGQDVQVPQYDFERHERRSEKRLVRAAPLIVVDGILLFSQPDLCQLFDLKIFVDVEPEVRVLRRVARDLTERGRSLEQLEEQFKDNVLPMQRAFLAESRQRADLLIPHGGRNELALEVLLARLLQLCPAPSA